MFAKLKKKIEVQHNWPGQNNIQPPRTLSPNGSNNSSAPVHYPANSLIHSKRTSQTKSPRTSMTEEEVMVSQIHAEDENNSNYQEFILNDTKTDQTERTMEDCDNKGNSELSDLLQEMELELTENHDQIQITNKQINNCDGIAKRLADAENQIKVLEAEIQIKNSMLNKIETEKCSLDLNEEFLACQKKLANSESENRAMKMRFDAKCQELLEVQQQISSVRNELEITCKNLEDSKEELNFTLKKVESMATEKEVLCSRLESTLKTTEELRQKIDMMKKEKADLIERHVVSMSELQTQIEVAEMDRRILEVKILDLEKKFEEDLKVTKEEARDELRKALIEVEEQIKEKNKLLKKQEQKLGDLRKVVQRELSGKQASVSNSNNCNNLMEISHHSLLEAEEAYFNNSSDVEVMADVVAKINVTSNETSSSYNKSLDLSQDLNFRYLKHVILKFFLSREHEALQLIKVVSMLLRFDSEEEKMIRDTLQWRTSWFRSKPQLPEKGQSAIVVPALY